MTQPDNTQWLDDLLSRHDPLITTVFPDGNPFKPGGLSQAEVKDNILSHIQANFNPKGGHIYLDIDLVKRDYTPNSEVESRVVSCVRRVACPNCDTEQIIKSRHVYSDTIEQLSNQENK